jgi:hypothetical protein
MQIFPDIFPDTCRAIRFLFAVFFTAIYLELSKILLYYDNVKPWRAAGEQVGIKAEIHVVFCCGNTRIFLVFSNFFPIFVSDK